MKKVIYLTLILLIFAPIMFAQSIEVTDPNTSNIWQKNVRNLIKWRVNGDMDNKVKIRLMDEHGRNKIKNIIDNVDNSGSFRCPANIFNDVPFGRYKIRVKTVDDRFSDDSNVFKIGPAQTDNNISNIPNLPGTLTGNRPDISQRVNLANIKITHPPMNHKWKLRLGNTALPFPIYIMWKKIGIGSQDRRVRILLQRVSPSLQKIIISRNTANSGLFRGSIPRNLMTNVYTIIIKTLDGKIRAESDDFFIINAADDPDSR